MTLASSSCAVALVMGCLCFQVAATERDPAAHWDFNEGKGDVLHDRSGNNNHGKIHGAKWVKCGKGHALRFDGVDDYVDCGSGPGLDVRGAISLEAWVFPEGIPRGEPGILGKQFSSYLLTYYKTGPCYWYICEGANHCKTSLSVGRWSHLVGTFDGTTVKLYLDGRLCSSRTSRFKAINPGGSFFIGCVRGDASAGDQAYKRTAQFAGLVDEVRIYNRALSDAEIAAHYERTAETRTVEPVVAFSGVSSGRSDQMDKFAVEVGDRGSLQINVGKDAYLIESAFSYPGDTIGTNVLSEKPTGDEEGWRPQVNRGAGGAATVTARGDDYSLERRIRTRGSRIEIEDTVTNLTDTDVGVIIENTVTAPHVFTSPQIIGTPENPTLFLPQKDSRLGLVAEDTISRLQFESIYYSNQAGFRLAHFALDAKKSYTFRWAVYVLPKDADYFTFINRIREDWRTNFTIGGGFEFLDARDAPVKDPEQLTAYLKRKNLKIVALGPWLDYWTGQHLTRAELKKLLQQAMRNFREADPEVKCVGEIETDWVALRPEQVKDFEKLPAHKGGRTGQAGLSAAQTKIVYDANLPWQDSFSRTPDGTLRLELYTTRGHPGTAILVYPQKGNYQGRFLMDQVKFLLDEVGMDGIYIDEFSQARRYSYERWDGHTVDMDPSTGRIKTKYTDCGLVWADGQRELCEYALDRGKIVVANWPAAQAEVQALPVFRFMELPLRGSDFSALEDGEKPPFLATLCRGHLASPIALGASTPPDARGFMKRIIILLRHGVLYYHHDPAIPATGKGSGEYGPINHMFPITPVRLFEGGIVGKERTITCVSGTYMWNHERPPRIFLFDEVGREKKHDLKPEKTDTGWKTEVPLRDWQEIAVIEE